jgi:hypothetical protein
MPSLSEDGLRELEETGFRLLEFALNAEVVAHVEGARQLRDPAGRPLVSQASYGVRVVAGVRGR